MDLNQCIEKEHGREFTLDFSTSLPASPSWIAKKVWRADKTNQMVPKKCTEYGKRFPERTLENLRMI